jgi:predicted PolB exonuclease-like 3'-5' exonuclease
VFCILDIETVPDDRLILDVFAEKPTDDLKLCRFRFDARNEKAAADNGGRVFPPLPYHLPVVAVLLVVDERGVYRHHRILRNPLTIIDEFWSLISQGLAAQFFNHIVTFNGAGFDLPVMELRAMQLGLCVPQWFRFGSKKWEDPRDKSAGVHIDLFDYIFAYGARPKAGLDVVSKLFSLPGKQGDGHDVEALHKEGEAGVTKIATYCAYDVVNTYGCLLRFLKANSCDVNPWADGAPFQSVIKGFSTEVDMTAFGARAASLAVATRERIPF